MERKQEREIDGASEIPERDACVRLGSSVTSKKARKELSAFLRGDGVHTVPVELGPFSQNVGPCGDISVLICQKTSIQCDSNRVTVFKRKRERQR